MSDHEWELWFLDQKINNVGIPVNLNTVRQARRLATRIHRKAEVKTCKSLDDWKALAAERWQSANGKRILGGA